MSNPKKLPEKIRLRDLIGWTCRIEPDDLNLSEYYGRVARTEFEDDKLFFRLVKAEIIEIGRVAKNDFDDDALVKKLLYKGVIRESISSGDYITFNESVRFVKNDFHDENLFDYLDRYNSVIAMDHQYDYIIGKDGCQHANNHNRFDDSIDNEDILRKRLEKIGITEAKQVSAVLNNFHILKTKKQLSEYLEQKRIDKIELILALWQKTQDDKKNPTYADFDVSIDSKEKLREKFIGLCNYHQDLVLKVWRQCFLKDEKEKREVRILRNFKSELKIYEKLHKYTINADPVTYDYIGDALLYGLGNRNKLLRAKKFYNECQKQLDDIIDISTIIKKAIAPGIEKIYPEHLALIMAYEDNLDNDIKELLIRYQDYNLSSVQNVDLSTPEKCMPVWFDLLDNWTMKNILHSTEKGKINLKDFHYLVEKNAYGGVNIQFPACLYTQEKKSHAHEIEVTSPKSEPNKQKQDRLEKETNEQERLTLLYDPVTKWEKITVILTSPERVRIKTPKINDLYSFYDLEMRDNRKVDKPNKLWYLLVDFAVRNGCINSENRAFDRTLADTAKRLNKHLKEIFGINESVFTAHYKKNKAYIMKIDISESE